MSGQMILEIDAGNTRTKWRLIGESGIVAARGHVASASYQDLATDLVAFKQGISGLRVASVLADEFTSYVIELFAVRLDPSSIYIAEQRPEMAGVQFCYQDVSRLGVDRCLVMAGAYQLVQSGVVVIDCGSAITSDYVSALGKHLGGYIIPGLALSRSALFGGTSRVANNDVSEGGLEPGCSTGACVDNGLRLSVAASVRAMVDQGRRMGISHFFLTGGGIGDLGLIEDVDWRYEPDLVFEGLQAVCPF